jgi:diguanylate cyclase (GGDEF)-like protein
MARSAALTDDWGAVTVHPDRFHPQRLAAALSDPERLEVLDRTGLMDSGPEQAFDRWSALAARGLRAPSATITLFDDERQFFKSSVGIDGLTAGMSAPASRSICQYVIAGAAPLTVSDVRAVPELRDLATVREYGVVAYAGTPICVHDQAVGTLCVTQSEPRVWTAADLELLADFAEAIAGETALRLAATDLHRSNALVAAHNRIHELISADAPLSSVLDEVVRSIEGYDPRLRGSVLLLDAVGRTIHHGAAPTLPPGYVAQLDGLVIGPDVGSCGAAAFHNDEIVSRDLETDPRWATFRPLVREHGLRHCWSFPIRDGDGDVLGTFGLYGSEPREPTEEHRRFIRDAAHLAGIAIQRQRATEELVHRATHDALTGLPNRMLLLDRLTQALARSRRSGTALAVLFIDLDRLKLVNETLGHEVGDEVLREVAERLAGCVRPGDTVARFGGDEFIAVCEDVDAERASAIAERALAAVAVAERGAAGGLSPTASIGVAVIPRGEAGAHEAIRRADEAMHAAKEHGGNRHRHSRDQGAAGAGRRLEVEAALRGALERGEFHLAAQPVVRFADGSLHGVEALLRWSHPDLGDVGPDEFVPIAEETGLIDAIGAWVVRAACAAAVQAQRAVGPDLALGVNVSPRQLRDPGFSTVVERALAETGLRASLLVVEITETALLGSDPTTGHTLDALRALGVNLVLDDFGTGFSSLSMLKERPIDGIKIDRSFVAGLPTDKSSGAIVAAVVGMAQALGRSVTAEGIETAEQLAFLRALGCDLAQGYLLGAPMSFGEIERWVPARAATG